MVDGGSVPFAVMYFDGEREINVATVMVDPSLNFKKFLSVLSHKIGISPHQFSVYLASLGSNRKIPITGKVNFAAMACQDGASFFFVKRPRRNKKNHQTSAMDSHSNKKSSLKNVMLLRQNNGTATAVEIEDMPFSEFRTTAVAPPILDRVEYEKRVRNLHMEREWYLMNMGLQGVPLEREATCGGGRVVCEEYSKAKVTGMNGGFHWCVNDEVTVGFRLSTGPIARP